MVVGVLEAQVKLTGAEEGKRAARRGGGMASDPCESHVGFQILCNQHVIGSCCLAQHIVGLVGR
jgi:hypothetical protein